MRHRSNNARSVSPWTGDFGTTRRRGHRSAQTNDNQASLGSQFDVDAWSLLVEEQRLLIAQAAGVDASKVRIRIGH